MSMSEDFFSALERLNTMSKKMSALLADAQGAPPAKLFHYTNSAGLKGIVQNKKLWATHHRFLNDASEIDYGMYVFGCVLDRYKEKFQNSVITDFLSQLESTADLFEDIDFYIACFCTKDDLLHQWRDYAGNGGYALGFDSSALLADCGFHGDFRPAYYLRRVIYDPKLQGELVEKTIDLAVAELSELTVGLNIREAMPAVEACHLKLQLHLSEMLTIFKHSSFEAEHEWRLVHLNHRNQGEPVNVREGQFGLTPFVELEPRDSKQELPIKSITHAPTKEAKNVHFALRALLRNSGLVEDVEIRGSIIPIRAC